MNITDVSCTKVRNGQLLFTCDKCLGSIKREREFWSLLDNRRSMPFLTELSVCMKCAPTQEEAQNFGYVTYSMAEL